MEGLSVSACTKDLNHNVDNDSEDSFVSYYRHVQSPALSSMEAFLEDCRSVTAGILDIPKQIMLVNFNLMTIYEPHW